MNWHSGFERIAQDRYETPDKVSATILPFIPRYARCGWEPACGSGRMLRALERGGLMMVGTDIDQGLDFLLAAHTPLASVRLIVTNPPYRRGLAQQFVEHAIELMRPVDGVVAMLLPFQWDMAQERAHLFEPHRAWRRKVGIRHRIRWFEGTDGNPRGFHCWMIWDWTARRALPPTYCNIPQEIAA